MGFNLIIKIAIKHLFTRVKQSAVAALGVTFGIAAYIILMSFMTGLNSLLDGMILDRTPPVQVYNESKISAIQPINQWEHDKEVMHVIHSVQPQQNVMGIQNATNILQYLQSRKEVIGITKQVAVNGYFITGAIQLPALINGVDIIKENDLYNLGDYVVEGNFKHLAEMDNAIIVGVGVAEKMGKKIGDVIIVNNIKGVQFPLKIVALYQSGMAELDNRQAYTSVQTAQVIAGLGNSYFTNINVQLTDMLLAPQFAQDIAQIFDVSAMDIQTANAQFDAGSSVRNLISYAVSFTLLLVAGFGIYNILNMMIYEKMNDIAILKAIGFSGGDVKWIFVSQALIIGIFGGLLGLTLGYGVSVLIAHTPFEVDSFPNIKTYPVNFNPDFYILGIIFALIATFLAGYLPAKKAEKIDPVDIIRGQ
jgi:lipoprotein-releasing system permease protein